MKYTSLIALIGMAEAINMSALENCNTHDNNRDECGESHHCSWFQGDGEGKGSCKSHPGSLAQKEPDCKQHDDNKDSCSEAAGCSWTQGYGTQGNCKAQKASVAQMKECKNYDNKKDECADKDSGCLWTQGHGTNGSCTVDPKASKKLALAQVSDC